VKRGTDVSDILHLATIKSPVKEETKWLRWRRYSIIH
jgi:hypothetical protein